MGEEYSVAQLAREFTDLRVQVARLETTQSANHAQNRHDIHDIRGVLDKIFNEMKLMAESVTNIKLKDTRWNLVAGTVTALVIKGIDILFHLSK